jgi:hypothetical protein
MLSRLKKCVASPKKFNASIYLAIEKSKKTDRTFFILVENIANFFCSNLVHNNLFFIT